MQTFLWILGISVGVFVAIVLAIVVGFWFIKWKLRKMFGGIVDGLEGILSGEPARIELHPDENARPEANAQEYARWVKEFDAAGLKRAGQFTALNQAGLVMTAWADEGRDLYAAVFVVGKSGVVADVVSSLADGGVLTHTTLKDTGLDRPEFAKCVRMQTASGSEMLSTHLRDRGSRAAKPASASAFQKDFEEIYARLMDWRILRGMTEAEVRRVAQHTKPGEELDKETIKTSMMMANAKYLGMLDMLLTEQLRKEQPMAEGQWQAMTNQLLFVHERSDAEQLARELMPSVTRTDELDGPGDVRENRIVSLKDEIVRMGNRPGFRSVAARAIPPMTFKHLGVVHGLVEADAWLRPEEPDDFDNSEDDGGADQDDERPG